jgi:hypothetical protein
MEEATQKVAISLGHERDHYKQDECGQYRLEKDVTVLDSPQYGLKCEKDAIKRLEHERD